MANQGYRVLALAMRQFPERPRQVLPEVVEGDLTFLGLAALIDPVRSEVPQAVEDCLTAGIAPIMITGDHPGTATAIAARLGIIDEEKSLLT